MCLERTCADSYAFKVFFLPHTLMSAMNAIRVAEDGRFPAIVFEELKKSGFPVGRLPEAQIFIEAFFERITPNDFSLHAPDRWALLVADLLGFMRKREPELASVRVYSPGNEGARTVIEVVTDDMPFLVDTVSMVAAASAEIHAVIHPVLRVTRDAGGNLIALGAQGTLSESVMRFEIDRLAEEELEPLRKAVEVALADVREAVVDWRPMRDRMVAIADSLASRELPLKPEEVAEAREFLQWVAADHFTFLGYREYEVLPVDGDEVLRAVDHSGLGILRGSERSMAPRRQGMRPS